MPKHTEKPSAGPRQARGRFVSRSIATSEQLASVSLLADYLFRSCIPHLDVAGRMTGNPALIKAGVVPLRDEINSRNLPELLRELAAAVDHDGIPLVFWYELNGAKVLEFPGFSKHQQGLRTDREASSKFPPRNGKELLLQPAGVHPDERPRNSGASPAQDEVEGEGEGEGITTTSSSARAKPDRATAPENPDVEPWTAPSEFAIDLDRIAHRLISPADVAALERLAAAVPHPLTWLAEIAASLDGMAGHPATTPAQCGEALREFVGNGALQQPNLRRFRRYLEQAATDDREPVASGQRAVSAARARPDRRFAGDRNDAAIDAWLAEKERSGESTIPTVETLEDETHGE